MRLAPRSRRTLVLTATTAALSATLVGALPASGHAAQVTPTASADAGLFGSQDPTYDGVYRQGLALLALDAAGGAIPPSSVNWLIRQRCANGSFMAYRANLRIPCSAPSSTTYSGPDTNSTALAVVALNAVRRHGEADRAAKWLVSHQNPDGGWAYYPSPGAATDANSTGLVMMALRAHGISPTVVRSSRARTGYQALSALQSTCSAAPADRGGIAFQSGGAPDELATAQASLGLVGTVRQQRNDAGVLPVNRLTAGYVPGSCAFPVRNQTGLGLDFLRAHLAAGRGALRDPFDPAKVSIGNTAYAVWALTAAGRGGIGVNQAIATLARETRNYVSPVSGGVRRDDAGRLALIALAARQAGQRPANFGGMNLVARLQLTRRV